MECGVSFGVYARWERDDGAPAYARVPAIARFLHLPEGEVAAMVRAAKEHRPERADGDADPVPDLLRVLKEQMELVLVSLARMMDALEARETEREELMRELIEEQQKTQRRRPAVE